jgi:GT2 family glycosyltransferase
MRAYNRLFAIAKERKQDLFLTQTDVIFPRRYNADWLQEMRRLSEERVDCGLITCYGGGNFSGPDFINGFFWVGGWCTYVPYRTIEKLGGYDENLPLGWGCDIDYTYAVNQAGLKVYTIDYWVDHHPNYVTGHEHEKVSNAGDLVKEAFLYLRKKWNVT